MKKMVALCLSLLILSSCSTSNNRNSAESAVSFTEEKSSAESLFSSTIESSEMSSDLFERPLSELSPYTIENPYRTAQLGFENELGQKIYLKQSQEELEKIVGKPSSQDEINGDEMGPGMAGKIVRTSYNSDSGKEYEYEYVFVYNDDQCICIYINTQNVPLSQENTWTAYGLPFDQPLTLGQRKPVDQSGFAYKDVGNEYITPISEEMLKGVPSNEYITFQAYMHSKENRNIVVFNLSTRRGSIILS